MSLKSWIFKIFLVVVLALLGIIVFRNVLLEDVKTIEQAEMLEVENGSTAVVKSGSFMDIDLVHRGQGEALITVSGSGSLLKLEEFAVTPGPDLFVYLSKNKNIKETKELGEFVSLGKLKSKSGDQVYILPDNYYEYNSVVIWCRAFGVLFSVAELS